MIPVFSTLRFILTHPFNRRAKLRAIGRYISWQIVSRMARGPILMPYVNGASLLVSKGMTGATGNIYSGLHEFTDMTFAGHCLRPGDLFVDIGANVGSYTILAASCGAKVLAYEPVASTFRALERNVKLNNFDNVITLKQAAVGSKPGTVFLTTAYDTTNHVAVGNEDGDPVPSVCLDDELPDDERFRVIKIDVEGFETEVIEGSRNLLSSERTLAVVIEMNGSSTRYGKTDEDIDSTIRRAGFERYTYDVACRAIRPTGKGSQGNTIYIRNFSEVAARLRTAAPLRILGENI
jgi:FkbM family methyltransferase